MPLTNPARNLYFNMDIENLDQQSAKEEPKGLLAPRQTPAAQQSNNMSSEPAFRVGQHMLLFRKEREKLKNA